MTRKAETVEKIARARADAEAFIAETTEALKGPMSNLERALLVADRREARAYLAQLEIKAALIERLGSGK